MAARIATLGAARDDGGQQAVLEQLAFGLAPGPVHLGHHLVADQHVAHHDVVLAGDGLGVCLALAAGMHGTAAVAVDDADLAVLEVRVGLGEFLDDLFRGMAEREEFDRERPEAGVGIGLRADGADVGADERAAATNGHGVGGLGDAEEAGLRVACDYGERHGVSVPFSGRGWP